MNLNILCKYCNTPISIRYTRGYVKCMCDDDIRVLDLNNILDLHESFYLLKKGGSVCHDGGNIETQKTNK